MYLNEFHLVPIYSSLNVCDANACVSARVCACVCTRACLFSLMHVCVHLKCNYVVIVLCY